jgi:hypothetical protein
MIVRRSILRTYKRQGQTMILTGFFGFLALWSLAALLLNESTQNRVEAVAGLILSMVFAIRAARSATVVQTEDEVIARSLLRTVHINKPSVSGFGVATGDIGLYGGRRGGSYLVVDLVDGGRRSLKGFTGPADDSGDNSVSKVAAGLNAAWQLKVDQH